MSSFLAEMSARLRSPVRLSLAEMDAIADVASQHRGSRELSSAVRRVRRAADRKRRALQRTAR